MNLPKGKLEGVSTNSPFTASAKIQGDVAADGLEVAAGGAGSVVLTDLNINRLSITKNGCASSLNDIDWPSRRFTGLRSA